MKRVVCSVFLDLNLKSGAKTEKSLLQTGAGPVVICEKEFPAFCFEIDQMITSLLPVDFRFLQEKSELDPVLWSHPSTILLRHRGTRLFGLKDSAPQERSK